MENPCVDCSEKYYCDEKCYQGEIYQDGLKKIDMQKIKTWEELSKCTSDTHNILINFKNHNGWIVPKVISEDSWKDRHYLSTHTFYGHQYKYSTNLLQKCGFNVELENWG